MKLPDILLEDDYLVAFDKASGLPMALEHSAKPGPSLLGALRAHYGPGMASVHRLDAETSGIVLCAKTKAALDFLSGQFQSKTVRKTSHALVVLLAEAEAPRPDSYVRGDGGALPKDFSVDLDLGEDENHRGRVRVFKGRGGKPSLTEFTVLEPFGRYAWVECRPLSGRMHQIRVHLASAGAPVLNDRLYGDATVRLLLSELKSRYKGLEEEKPLVTRLALHASALEFVHPATRTAVRLEAPLPKDLAIALKYLRKFA